MNCGAENQIGRKTMKTETERNTLDSVLYHSTVKLYWHFIGSLAMQGLWHGCSAPAASINTHKQRHTHTHTRTYARTHYIKTTKSNRQSTHTTQHTPYRPHTRLHTHKHTPHAQTCTPYTHVRARVGARTRTKKKLIRSFSSIRIVSHYPKMCVPRRDRALTQMIKSNNYVYVFLPETNIPPCCMNNGEDPIDTLRKKCGIGFGHICKNQSTLSTGKEEKANVSQCVTSR